MEDGMSLNEIELKLCLLKKRTKKAIAKNEALLTRLEQTDRKSNDFIASLEGRPPPILEDDSLFNGSLGSDTTESVEHSDPEPHVQDSDSSASGSFAEQLRNGVDNNGGIVEPDSSSSSYEATSVSTTASSTKSREQAFLEMSAVEEERILARLDFLLRGKTSISNANQESDDTNTAKK